MCWYSTFKPSKLVNIMVVNKIKNIFNATRTLYIFKLRFLYIPVAVFTIVVETDSLVFKEFINPIIFIINF